MKTERRHSHFCYALLLLLVASGPAFAHHGSNASYTDRTITLQGTVVELQWSNPHAILKFNVKNAEGNVVLWLGELHPPNLLIRDGWTRDCLKPGDQITVVGFPPKAEGAHVMQPLTVKAPDGAIYSPRPNQPPPKTEPAPQQ